MTRIALLGVLLFAQTAVFGTTLSEKFIASNGKSSEFTIETPDDVATAKPRGVLVYLHGDGGEDYKSFFKKLKKVAAKYDLIPLSVLSPTNSSDGPSWWWEADPDAVFLDELLHKQVFPKYAVDKNRMIFTGISGGTTFLAGPWIRHYGHEYRGGAVLMCGDMSWTEWKFQDAPGFKDNFAIYQYISTGDYLLPGAKDAAAYYTKKGMKVVAEYPPGDGHCDFYDRMHVVLDERIAQILH